MSTTKALLTISVLAAGPCVATEDPTPRGVDDEPTIDVLYDCADVFDTNCRFEAEVSIDGGTLSFYESGDSLESVNETLINGATGTVVLRDTDGLYDSVTCHFTLDADLRVADDGTYFDVDTSSYIQLDQSCPVTCAWFLPQSGLFHDGAFGTYMAGNNPGAATDWTMQYGDRIDYSSQEGPVWFRTAPVDADISPDGWPFFEDAPLVSSTWTAPMTQPDTEGDLYVECWGAE